MVLLLQSFREYQHLDIEFNDIHSEPFIANTTELRPCMSLNWHPNTPRLNAFLCVKVEQLFGSFPKYVMVS